MSTTRLQLEQLLSESISDYLEFDTTTNITTNTTIVSTTLTSYDGGYDSYFVDWWVSFQEGNNAAVAPRQVSAYTCLAGTLTIRGANLAAETGAVTLRLHRFNPNNKWKAINRALEQVPLYKPVHDQTIVTGNILPNAHFEDWTTASIPDFWEVTNATAAATTAVALIRGAAKSAQVTASAADGVMTLDSENYPPLLDLMNRSVNGYVWAYPQTVNDAFITIYTLKADGTAQTLSSITACPAGKWSLLKLEDQVLNDDLVKIEFRLRVHTNGQYAYFDDAILCGMSLREYPIPSELQQAHIRDLRIQTSGYSDKPCYDLQSRYWGEPEEFQIIRTGDYLSTGVGSAYDRFQLGHLPVNYYRMRIIGLASLTALTADTSTIWIDGEKLNLIIYKAKELFYKMEQGPVSSEDKGRYWNEIVDARNEYRMAVPSLMMQTPAVQIKTGD